MLFSKKSVVADTTIIKGNKTTCWNPYYVTTCCIFKFVSRLFVCFNI